MKESYVAYTILTGLGERYGSLVTTLTNMISPENPLTVPWVTEAILTEEMRLKNVDQAKAEKNTDNPLAFKHDTSFKGSLSSALVAHSSDQHSNRQFPYSRGSGGSRGGSLPYRGRGGYGAYGGYRTYPTSFPPTSFPPHHQRYYSPLLSPTDNPRWSPEDHHQFGHPEEHHHIGPLPMIGLLPQCPLPNVWL